MRRFGGSIQIQKRLRGGRGDGKFINGDPVGGRILALRADRSGAILLLHALSAPETFRKKAPFCDGNQQLTDWLRQVEAIYDPVTKVYHVPGKQPSNPVTIANAFLPGEMPDLYRDSNHEVKGISLLVKPPLHKRRNQQMIVFVDLAKQAAEVFQGKLLNAEREPATDATYQRIIG